MIYRKNIVFTQELVDYCKLNKVPFFFASSASIYGNKYKSKPLSEEFEPSPNNLYAWSKLQSENYIRHTLSESNTSWWIGRFFNVWGNGEHNKGNMKSPVSNFIDQATKNKKIQVFSGIEGYTAQDYKRDFISVDLIVNNIVKIINGEVKPNCLYNFGTGRAISFYFIATIISKAFNVEITEIPFPSSLLDHYQYCTISDVNRGIKNGLEFDVTQEVELLERHIFNSL
jgi:ADP-L-glycero-D-manno-heptose 6-epimerase